MTIWSELARALAPVAMKAAEIAIARVAKVAEPRRAHYYRSRREVDGSWFNEDYCAYCNRFDPRHTIYTEPSCPGEAR